LATDWTPPPVSAEKPETHVHTLHFTASQWNAITSALEPHRGNDKSDSQLIAELLPPAAK
jgi:hypothetical protein